MEILGKEAIFWALFLTFNFILFLTNSLLHFDSRPFLPLKKILNKRNKGIFESMNPDFYRLSIDLSFFILLVRSNLISSFLLPTLSVFYIGILLFNGYYYSFLRLYSVSPVLINDIRLLKNGIGILYGESKLKVLCIATIIPLLAILVYQSFLLYLQFTSSLSPNLYSISGTALILIYFLVAIVRVGINHHKLNLNTELRLRNVIMLLRIFKNAYDSYMMMRVQRKIDFKTLAEKRNVDLDLSIKPNIYCLFIESYGSILLKDPQLKESYQKDFESFSEKLESNLWHKANNLSRSISLVGPSWLAYSTILNGYRIENNFQFENILNNTKFHNVGGLIKDFQKQGYKSYNLNATKHKPGVKVPFDKMANLYGVDKWILRDDIPYSGKRYGFTEGPTDQYVLNYAFEEIINKNPEPYILFYLTKNSHSPFIGPKSVVSNWRDLNDGNDQLTGHQLLKKPALADYSQSIKYQLDFISDFIINKGTENDVFLMLGDHQPHHLANVGDHGLETLVHVISKNKDFVRGFRDYGFSSDNSFGNLPIKHEALYSIFIREIMKSYGKQGASIPNYEPDGLQVY
ncbi:MAG: hypothetical protein JXR03_17025 [Cyclobacteriaceae bacterium]